MELLSIPPRSPDLNPIERYWGWLRRQLRLKDLEDLRKKRRPLGKTAYKARVRAFLKTAKAQSVAKAMWRKMKKVAAEVAAKKGAAAGS